MSRKVLEQILTNQLCIMASLKTLGRSRLLSEQVKNLEKRIEETFKVREKLRGDKE